MDREQEYRAIVKRIVQDIAKWFPTRPELRVELICDETLGHYQLGEVGWDKKHRVDDIFIHIDVLDGKVWIQHDGTNLKLAEEFVRAGIPKDHIVLAFHHPNRRPDTEYAVA